MLTSQTRVSKWKGNRSFPHETKQQKSQNLGRKKDRFPSFPGNKAENPQTHSI